MGISIDNYTIDRAVGLDLFFGVNVSDIVGKIVVLIDIIGKKRIVIIIQGFLDMVIKERVGLIVKGFLLKFHVIHHSSDVIVVFFSVRTLAQHCEKWKINLNV